MALEADYNSERSRVSNGLGTRHAGFRNTAGMEIHVNGEVQQVPAGLTVLGLLEAFAELRRLISSPLQLVLVGRMGWLYQGILARAQELDLGQDIVVTGYVPDADLPALYSGATLFVLPSLYEGFAMPVLEAMACGVPVACSNVSSLPEVAGDAALLFDPRSVDGMVAAIKRGLEDAELRAMLSRRGRERAQQFTWERCARQVLNVLEQVDRTEQIAC